MSSRSPHNPWLSPPCLHEPPTPKFALASLLTIYPPPVMKSHCCSWARAPATPPRSTNAAITSTLIPLRIILSPLACQSDELVNPGGRRRDDHVRDAGDDHMEGIHDGGGR